MLKSTFYTLILVIAMAIISIVGYLYSVVYVGGLGGDLGQMYDKSDELSQEHESLVSIQRVAQNSDQRNTELSKYIVSAENEGPIKFVKTIEESADAYNLKSNTVAIEIISDDNLSKINKEYLNVKETLVGTKSSIAAFVKNLEFLPYNTKIKSYSLTNINTAVSAPASLAKEINQQLDLEILVVKEK